MPSGTLLALQDFFARIRLARASELAQSGRLLEAEAVLMHDGDFPDSPQELDLLARIAARQGRFDTARRLWNTAAKLDPDNEVYRHCIESLTPAMRIVRVITASLETFLPFLVLVTAVLGVAALVFAFCF